MKAFLKWVLTPFLVLGILFLIAVIATGQISPGNPTDSADVSLRNSCEQNAKDNATIEWASCQANKTAYQKWLNDIEQCDMEFRFCQSHGNDTDLRTGLTRPCWTPAEEKRCSDIKAKKIQDCPYTWGFYEKNMLRQIYECKKLYPSVAGSNDISPSASTGAGH